ncbi:MAG: hypothetical protein AAGA67_04590 [Cyanobacteria bacterium P01_F01_bin.153]
MEIIVHIGMPKTGTTALQRTLGHNRHLLQENGILYPEGVLYKDEHKELVAALRSPKTLSRSLRQHYSDNLDRRNVDYEKFLGSVKATINEHDVRTVIFSAEGLFNTRIPEKLQKFEQDLRQIGDHIHVVVYIRNPAGHYLSHAQQVLKGSHILPRFKNRQYRNKISRFMGMADALTVAAFERDQLKGGDITQDFMGRVFPNLPNLQNIIAPQIANETMSAEAMDILQQHRLQRFSDQPNIFMEETDRLRNVLTQLDRNLPGYTRPRLLPDVRELVVALNPDLLWLHQKFGLAFKGINPQTTPKMPADIYQPETVADICKVNAARRKTLAKILENTLKNKD